MKKFQKRIKVEASKVLKTLQRFKIQKSLLLIIILMSASNILTPVTSTDTLIFYSHKEETPLDEYAYVYNIKSEMEKLLIDEVSAYIKEVAPDSKLTPEKLVTKCLAYKTDIVFVLSQALLESHFGTKGKAAVTNSVWNVGTFDDGQILYSYAHPDESLEPYLTLINEKYLISVTPRGDTVFKNVSHLIEDRGYKNYKGKRFASAKGYEDAMRKIIIKIDHSTKISFYQEVVMLSHNEMIAYLNPKT